MFLFRKRIRVTDSEAADAPATGREFASRDQNSSNMEEFECLDVILMISGCKIFIHNPCMRIINHMMRMMIIICYVATFVYSLESSFKTGGVLYLTVVERYSQELCGLFFIFTINWNARDIRKLLTDARNSLKPEQLSSLRVHAIVSMFVICMTLGQDVALSYYHLFYTVYVDDAGHIFLDMARSFHFFNSWLLGGCAVYAFFVKIIQFRDENYFESLRVNAADLVPENAARLALERRNVMIARNRLLKTFSLIPCLWFLHTFIKAPCLVLQLGHWFHYPIEQAWRIIPLVYQILAVAYLVFLCDASTQYTRKKVDDVVVEMMSKNSIIAMDVFVTELERSGEQQFTVWKTLVINRKFFLAFVSSLVTFTVFFIEITEEVIKDEVKPSARQLRITSKFHPKF